MAKSCDITLITPHAYTKKSSKSVDLKKTDDFIEILQNKLNNWQITSSIECKDGAAHKLKFSRLESHFFDKSHLVVYIVCLLSEDSFRLSIKRLLNTYQQKDTIYRVLVISLDAHNFPELQDGTIDTVHLTNDAWGFEDEAQWNLLEEKLRAKLLKATSNCPSSQNSDALTLPLSNANATSPSKIKKFFHYRQSKKTITTPLPTKTSQHPAAEINTFESFNDLQVSDRNHHSKVSLTSLFKKRLHTTKDVVSCLDSPSSSYSGSKKSDATNNDKCNSLDIYFDNTSEISKSSDKSKITYHGTEEKTKKCKSKIHNLKNKANKTLHSANCLHNQEHRRTGNISDAVARLAMVSNFLITTTSDIFINDLESQTVKPSRNGRCMSEPPCAAQESYNCSPLNARIRFHSWNNDIIKYQEFISDELSYSNDEIEAVLQGTEHESPYHTAHQIDGKTNQDLINSSRLDDTFPGLSFNSQFENDEDNTENNIDQKYFQIHYVTSLENMSLTTTKPDWNGSPVSNYTAKKHKRKNHIFNENKNVPRSFKVRSENFLQYGEKDKESIKRSQMANLDALNNTNRLIVSENIQSTEDNFVGNHFPNAKQNGCFTLHSNRFDHSKLPLPKRTEIPRYSVYRPPSIKLDMVASAVQPQPSKTTNSLLRNPIFVGGLFTATALTAPLWSAFIPNGLDVCQILYSTVNHVLKNEMVQAIPNQLVSAARVGTVTTTNSLKTFFTVVPSNSLFNSYRIIFF